MKTPSFRIKPLGLDEAAVTDGFLAERMGTNRTVTLDVQYDQLVRTGRLAAWKQAAGRAQGPPPHIFRDSDVAKWIEAAAYVLATGVDADLEARVDAVIDDIAAAQRPDGYLNTHYIVAGLDGRWTNLRDAHELYCAGHLIEAAVAYRRATGKGKLLDVLHRYVEHIAATFGPGRGRKRGYPGHEEIELALVKLHRETGEALPLKLAAYFIDERGRRRGGKHYFDIEADARGEASDSHRRARSHEYNQSHRPVREQREVVGHAVRAFYLYAGMADVAGETHDTDLLAACRRLWADATERKMYVTGGIGSSMRNEGFTAAYDLPNASAYAETCAAIALVFFAHRMLQIDPGGAYADVMERAIYNGVLSGVSLDGRRFFYANPLAVGDPGRLSGTPRGEPHRSEWFGCACCPPNIARLIASLPAYCYSVSPKDLYVHLYAAGEARCQVGGRAVTLRQETRYPWDGRIRLNVSPDAPAVLALRLRIPGWCRCWRATLNGREIEGRVSKGYLRLRRRWEAGDAVELTLEMPVERVAAHPLVAADAGRVALCRGPLVYCLEQCDHAAAVEAIRLPDAAALTARFDADCLGGVTVIEGPALAVAKSGWKGRLYRPAGDCRHRPARIRAVPYCLWDNRTPGAMAVWLPRE